MKNLDDLIKQAKPEVLVRIIVLEFQSIEKLIAHYWSMRRNYNGEEAFQEYSWDICWLTNKNNCRFKN